MVLTTSAVMLAVSFVIAIGIGFPVPFGLSLSAGIWLPMVICFLWLARGQLIRENEQVRKELKQFAQIGMAQMASTVIYQAFYAAFSQMSPSTQPKFVFMLWILKLVQKNVISRIMDGKEDLKPDVVIFNVELFHSMFVSCCMQRSTSITTTFVLIGVDFVQACSSLYDLTNILSVVKTLAKGNGIHKEQFVDVALRIMSRDPSSRKATTTTSNIIGDKHPTDDPALNIVPIPTASTETHVNTNWFGAERVYPFLSKSPPTWIHPTPRILPQRKSARSAIAALTSSQQELFAQHFLRAMFLAEFLLLIEFVQVMIPVAYCVYLLTLFHLPNRVFYPHMANVDEEKMRSTIQSVLLYAIMELISFLALSALIKRHLPISGIHHLAFVLETHAVAVQSKLVLWFLFVLQSTLVHLGADYSFKFAWLHSPFHSGFVVYAAFTKLSRKGQTKFALLLPVIKLIEKNLISRVAINVDDVKPELVIFNVKGFNASSVSFCMQSAGSLQNSVPLVAADFLQAALSMC
ncbi:hypothetical protein Gpo141_00008503 [Globisporangium polare]